MKQSKKVFLQMYLPICAFLGVELGYNAYSALYTPRPNEVSKYYFKTDRGSQVHLPIYNNNVAVVLDKTLTDSEKKNITDGIKKIDASLDSVSYTINYGKEEIRDNKYIRIQMVDSIEDNEHIGGVTHIECSQKTGEILYPVSIEIAESTSNLYMRNEEGAKSSVLSLIVQHECCHALGLRDLYEDEYNGKSAMYFQINEKGVNELTDFDKYNLQYVYDKHYLVSVKLPNQDLIKYLCNPKDEDEMTF